MKYLKSIVALGALLVATSSALAQGQITFYSIPDDPGTPFGRIFQAGGTSPVSGSGFAAQLWGGSANNPSSFVALSSVFTPFATTAAAGYVTANETVTLDGTGGKPSAAVNSGFFYQVRAWNTAAGATFAAASANNGQIGLSQVVGVTLGGTPAQGNPVTPPITDGFSNFALVPEPSVLALGILGGAVLLFRRRK